MEVDSFCASLMSSCLAARASPRWASSEAKCAPRRRPKASRAAANRVHSASSVLRSMPRIVFHSSTIALSRSPAAFQDVDSAAICSASAASASLRAICAGAGGRLLRAGLGGRRVGGADHRPRPRGQPVEVADRRGGRDRLGEDLRLALDLGRVAGVRLQPRLEQRDLGGQVVVAAAVVGQPRGRLAGLPGADGALAVGGAHVDGAVLVDPAPRGGVADLGGGHLDRRGRGRRRPGGGRRGRGRGGMGRGDSAGGGGPVGRVGGRADGALGGGARRGACLGRGGRLGAGRRLAGRAAGVVGGAASAAAVARVPSAGGGLGVADRGRARRSRGRVGRLRRRAASGRGRVPASGVTASGAAASAGCPCSPPPRCSRPAFSAIGGAACCAPSPGLSVLDTSGSVPRRIRDTCCRDRRSRRAAGADCPRDGRRRLLPVAAAAAPRRRGAAGAGDRRAAPRPARRRSSRMLAQRPDGGGRGRRRGRARCPVRRRATAATCAASASTWSRRSPAGCARRAPACPCAHTARRLAARRGRASRAPGSASARTTWARLVRDLPGPVGVLAMGDGSARRTVKAPGLPGRGRRALRRRGRRRPGRRGRRRAGRARPGRGRAAAGRRGADLAGGRGGAGRPGRRPPGCTSTPRRSASATWSPTGSAA